MKTYIVILRGINVSGKNKLPMTELRRLLCDLKFENVQTYIQSGNIVLNSELPKAEIAKKIKESIKKQFEYEVPVLVRTIDEWEKTIVNNPYSERQEQKKMYFTFLEVAPKETFIEVHKALGDEYTIIDDVVYLYCEGGYGNTKLSNNLFEKKLKVTATSRNYRTTMKLLEMATT